MMGYHMATTSAQALKPGLHGLIVDDAVMDGFLASCILRQEGYEVTLAKSGMEAVEAVAKTNYDFVLMDMRMPGMDGFEATHRIRQLAGLNGQIPIMALTAMDLGEHDPRLSDAGMDGVISKPVDPEALRVTLSRVNRAKLEPASYLKVTGKTFSPDKTPEPPHAHAGTHKTIDLLEEDLALSQPGWASFRMEGAFWTAVSEICLAKKIEPKQFIDNAKQRHVGIPEVSAVRLEVIKYFRKLD